MRSGRGGSELAPGLPVDPEAPRRGIRRSSSSGGKNRVIKSASFSRRLPVGAEAQPAGGVHFRVWAPRARRVEAVLLDAKGESIVDAAELAAESGGYHSGPCAEARVGSLYKYRLDGRELCPDPASRFQPAGPHGASQVVDPAAFAWTDRGWRGAGIAGQVLYEMHVGTFTREGTWAAASRELPELADLGVTVLELMPVADFCGRFGWGYDGVAPFAPTRLYGTPDDFRRFVDRAHGAGLAVILDVVYNHVGPDGSALKAFSDHYFTDRYANEWGEPLNFDGPENRPVRELFVANAGYWVDEFHLDGLRLDATSQVFDASKVHVLAEVTARVREAAGSRATIVIAENEPQQVKLLEPASRGGYGMDGTWNDDFHHAARVAATGRREAYYGDYHGTPQELVSVAKRGFLYQGQRCAWQKKRRGTSAAAIAPHAFVNYLQNHDQIANSAFGQRLGELTDPGRLRALTAFLLLSPGTPLLFQGQEFAASSPFLFFADHKPELAAMVREGRARFVTQFPSIATEAVRRRLPDPGDPRTFERCKLDLGERERHAEAYALHRDLLRLRRDDPAFHAAPRDGMDGAVIGPEAFVLRFFAGTGDRLLVVNLGRDLALVPAPEPLLAPPAGSAWKTLWSSEDPRYGGCGAAEPETEDGWRVPGHAAMVLAPEGSP